jgi:hypothetical protein
VTEFHWMDLEWVTSPWPLCIHRNFDWPNCESLLAQSTEKYIHFHSSISQTNSATQTMEGVRSFETWEYEYLTATFTSTDRLGWNRYRGCPKLATGNYKFREYRSNKKRGSIQGAKTFLDGFTKFSKNTISFAMSACTSVHPHAVTRLPLDGFSWNFVFNILKLSVQKIPVSLKSDKNNERFQWISIHIFCIIVHSVHLKVSCLSVCLSGKVVDKFKTQILYSVTSFSKIVPFMRSFRNMAQPDRPRMTI